MGDYQRLQTAEAAEAEFSAAGVVAGHHGSRVTNNNKTYYYKRPMTPMHRAAFIGSIAFVAVVILFFIWGLPCDVYHCGKDGPVSISWDKTLSGLELRGRMHLVSGNLIAILRSAKYGKSQNQFPKNAGGVIALFGKNGNEVYWLSMNVLPRYIDCSTLDPIENSGNACLIVGDSGYMAALNPVTGLLIWKINVKDASMPRPKDVDVPISIPDVNSDGHNDLVTLSRFDEGKHRVAIISGATGEVLVHPRVDSDCEVVSELQFDYSRATLNYACSAFGLPANWKEIKLNDVLPRNSLSNPSMSRGTLSNRVMIPKDERMRFIVGNGSSGEHRVLVSNQGTCPDNCFVSINVTDCQNKTIWTYHMDKTYVMYPIPLHFKHSITGFLLKMWHWHTPAETRSTGGIRVEMIKERIVLITFNESESIHVQEQIGKLAASQTDIIQLCEDNECQPHLSFQTQSALIADLNGDGTQDLISYFVTYRPKDEESLKNLDRRATELSPQFFEDWTLESRVRVVRLESELQKFPKHLKLLAHQREPPGTGACCYYPIMESTRICDWQLVEPSVY